MTDDSTAQSFFNYITVCLKTPDLYNKYFRHAYESFLYSSPRVRFVYMQLLIYFQEGWKFGPCGSSSWVISLILHISCVFFFGRAQFTFNLCSALCIFLVRFWFELTYGQLGWRQEELSLVWCISCCHFCSRGQISAVCHYKEQMPLISDPNLFLSHTDLLYVLLLLHSLQMHLWWEVRNQELGQCCVFKFCTLIILTVSYFALSIFCIWGS